MSSDKYEQYYKECGRMFECAINRVLSDPDHSHREKVNYMIKIHYYIDKSCEKRFE